MKNHETTKDSTIFLKNPEKLELGPSKSSIFYWYFSVSGTAGAQDGGNCIH